jgi:hypothetical protein
MNRKKSRFLPSALFIPGILIFALAPARNQARASVGQPEHGSALPTELWRSLRDIPRNVPTPAPDHPGNVFLAGEQVTVGPPQELPANVGRWQVLDDQGTVVARGSLDQVRQTGARSVTIGRLDIGWYRVEFLDAAGEVPGWTTAAVLARLVEPVPQDSPICVDSATSWFAPNEPVHQEGFARLAALAGANWIRDRMSWAGAQTRPDQFAQNMTYDSAATLQARHGLKVLQVFHDTPRWAADKQLDGNRARGRFPRDLRVLYRFCKAVAGRYQGRVLAWEPWNEANITAFGGHTIDEMCSHQKAAYLGFKAGDPNVIVCWNVYAGAGTPLHAEGVLENEAWPYFETYNIHSYNKPDNYLEQFKPAREAARGRPIWLTECGIALKAKTDGPWSDLSLQDELQQAKFIARSYASSLFAGVNRHFFFILGNYRERAVQFGLLRKDQTPRPGYVALAAVGRLLTGATCLGRWLPKDNPSVRIYAFRARPDSLERDVLVAWAEKPTTWSPPVDIQAEAIHDYLGRPLGTRVPAKLDSAVFFIVLHKDAAGKLPLESPPSVSSSRPGKAPSVVLQLQMPHTATDLSQQAHVVAPDAYEDLAIFAYNFGLKPASGTVNVESVPRGWTLVPDRWEITLDPMERKLVTVRLRIDSSDSDASWAGWIKLRGHFADAGEPILAFRLIVK